jgi:hypothetical protein
MVHALDAGGNDDLRQSARRPVFLPVVWASRRLVWDDPPLTTDGPILLRGAMMWQSFREWLWLLTCPKCKWCGLSEPKDYKHTTCRYLRAMMQRR